MANSYFLARIVENRVLGGGTFVLELDGCDALSNARPGQFVMVRGAWGRDPLLPRAFSILATRPGGRIELLIKAVGRATRLLETAHVGDVLSILGPLGGDFPATEPGRTELLVAGGVGLAPLLWYAERAPKDARLHLFYGARSDGDLALLDRIAATSATLHITTEDGSRGTKGRVTAALDAFLADPAAPKDARILTCGPNPMMRAVAELAKARGLSCLVSVEGEMACGIGVCLGCAVPTPGAERPFAYACVHGPVFDATRITLP